MDKQAETNVTFTLDGQAVEVAPGTTILTAARDRAIDIPTFCYQDRLSILASCRMCLVEVEGRPKLEPACATVAADGMVVHSRSAKVVAAREDMLEILLANHPLDCPICDKGGECELQDTVYEYGRGESRFYDQKRVFRTRDIELNKVIIFNADRCIQCQRCVRVCEEVVGEVALGTAERGLDSEITGVGDSLSGCSHCGNCIEVCPVGALMSTPYRYRARPWDMARTETICNMCGTGCSRTIETRDGRLMRVKSRYDTGLNGELLCAKGRFGFDSIDGGERLSVPMIRKGGVLTPVSWDEAIGYIVNMTRSVKKAGGHFAGLISPRQTNETADMFQKMMRRAFGSPDIEAGCRFDGLYRPSRAMRQALRRVMRDRYSRLPLDAVLRADCILLMGSNVTEENPVTGYLIREALWGRTRAAGRQLFVASSRPCGLDDIARARLRLLPGTEGHILSRLTAADASAEADQMTDFVLAAREAVAQADSVTLLIGTEFMRTSGAGEVLHWIDQAIGSLEQRGRRVFLQFLFDRPNQLGVWDRGCLAGMAPGWRLAEDEALPASMTPDLIYVLGADPLSHGARDDPRVTAVRAAGCLVVQDSHLTKVAERAHVVLPMPSYGEEEGTYTNNEGRLQKLRPIRPPAHSVPPAIEVMQRIAAALGVEIAPEDTLEDLPGDVAEQHEPHPMPNLPAVMSGQNEQGYWLITGDSLFHSGRLSTRSEILSSLGDGPYVEMNPGGSFSPDAGGYTVTVTRRGATLTAPLKINRDFPAGVIYIPENILTNQPDQADKLLSSFDYPGRVDAVIR